MNEHAELERVLSCLTIDELKYLKERLLTYYFTKESDYLDLTKINSSVLLKNYNKGNLYNIFEVREIEDCVNAGINSLGITKMEKLVDEMIEEKQNKEITKETDKGDAINMKIYGREMEVKTLLKDLNVYELEHIERRLSEFIKRENKTGSFQVHGFFESKFKEYYEIDEIEDIIETSIIKFGIFRVHDLVVDLLQEKTIENFGISGKFAELQRKIISWGKSKSINDPKSQFLKVIEEFGEIQSAKNKEEFEDAIGDTLVTIIILNDILQRSVKEDNEIDFLIDTFFEEDFYCYAKQKGKLNTLVDLNNDINNDIIIELSRIAEYISKTTDGNKEYYVEKMHLHILEIARYVRYLSEWANSDYIECLQLAYDTIANRKGKTIDGVFVKEKDLQKEER